MMFQEVENHMVMDEMHKEHDVSDDVIPRFDGPGYISLETGVFVRQEDAFGYAIEQCIESFSPSVNKVDWTIEFREMLVEWFYSNGNWVKEE